MTSFTSTGHSATDRPARYGKQLMNHMNRKANTTWDEDSKTGRVEFADGVAAADLRAEDGALTFALSAQDEEALARFEWVLGIHLIRFGAREGLECHWTRADGTAGSSQTPADLEEKA